QGAVGEEHDARVDARAERRARADERELGAAQLGGVVEDEDPERSAARGAHHRNGRLRASGSASSPPSAGAAGSTLLHAGASTARRGPSAGAAPVGAAFPGPEAAGVAAVPAVAGAEVVGGAGFAPAWAAPEEPLVDAARPPSTATDAA